MAGSAICRQLARQGDVALVTAARAVRRAAEQGQSVVAERASRRIVAVYDAIVLRGLAFHEQQPALGRRPGARGKSARRPGHNLLVRLRDFKTEVLRFLFDFAVPFTNNQADSMTGWSSSVDSPMPSTL